MSANAGKTVAEILTEKKAGIKTAPLESGSPSWDEILHLTWEEVVRKAQQREPGFDTFKKLLEREEVQQMKRSQFPRLLDLLERLEVAKISYDLEHSREDALMVRLVVPGEYWEIEFLKDGKIEIERYRSNGHIYDESMLENLFAKYSADSPEPTSGEICQSSESFFQYLDLPDRKETAGNAPLPSATGQARKRKENARFLDL